MDSNGFAKLDDDVIQDLAYEDTDVPEWGGLVRVQALTAYDATAFSKYCTQEAKSKHDANVHLACLAIVYPDGKRPFVDSRGLPLKDKLSKRSVKIINDLAKKALALSGMNLPGVGEEETKNA